MDLFAALQASAIHRAQKVMEGGATGKRYTVVIAVLTSAEAARMTGRSYDDDDEYYTLDFSGDLPAHIRSHYSGSGNSIWDDKLSPAGQAILREALQRTAKAPIGYSGLRQTLFDWGIDPRVDWMPL